MLRTTARFLVGLALTAGAWTPSALAGKSELLIDNPGAAFRETPILTTIDAKMAGGTYRLIDAQGKPTDTYAEILESDGQKRLAVLLPTVASGKTMFTLEGPIGDRPATAVQVKPVGKNLEIQVGGKPFTTYAVDLGPKPILYPLLGPNGERLTRSYPMTSGENEERDHPHHRSLWFTHGKVNGVDFWSEIKGHGTIEETSREVISLGQAGAVVRTRDLWRGSDGKEVCQDERILRIFGTREARVLDFEVRMIASKGPLVLGDTKEGTFALRVASTMDARRKGGGRILNAEGLENTKTWGKRSKWVDYTGPVDGVTAGISILDHPQSFGHPTPWHVRDYGLFAANPFGLHDFGEAKSGDTTVPEGESITFRYRVILHSGEVAPSWIEDMYRGYATPPTVTVKEG